MSKLNKYGLTDKEEKFCQLFVEIGNGTEAYIQAYDSDCNRETAANESYKIRKKEAIYKRIDMIREEAAKVFLKRKEEILQDLLDILKATKHSEKEKAIALKAIEQYSKMLGYYEPEKVEIDHTWEVKFDDGDDGEEE